VSASSGGGGRGSTWCQRGTSTQRNRHCDHYSDHPMSPHNVTLLGCASRSNRVDELSLSCKYVDVRHPFRYAPLGLVVSAVLLVAGCGTPPSSQAPLSTNPDPSVTTGYLNGFSYSYPANWTSPQSASAQQTAVSTSLIYGQVDSIQMQEFPSFINSNSQPNIAPLSAFTPQITNGVNQLAASLGMSLSGNPTATTILQLPGLIYSLSRNGTSSGSVIMAFTGQVQVIVVCQWRPPYTQVGSSACNEIVGTLATSQGLGGFNF
jgi:hypothetical protein